MYKTTMIVVMVAMLITAMGAWATDLNCSDAWAGATTIIDPSMITGNMQFKKLISNCDAHLSASERVLINTDDSSLWTYTNPNHKRYTYMILKFIKPANFNGGHLYWRTWQENLLNMEIYYWDYTAGNRMWVKKDEHFGGIGMTRHFPVSSNYFDASEGSVMYILVTTKRGATANGQDMYVDVCDTHYNVSNIISP